MGQTRKRRQGKRKPQRNPQRGGVELAQTIQTVQRMDTHIDVMTRKINGLKALLQEPLVPIPESAFRAPAPPPSVAAVPPHLRSRTLPSPPSERTVPRTRNLQGSRNR
jgi:hypothetical protein